VVEPVDGRRPVVLVVVCLLVLVEALAFVGLALGWLVELLRGRTEIPGAVAFLVAFALGMAVLLAACARGLWRGRRWARSPVVLWQVLLVVLAIGWLGSGITPWGVAVVVIALITGVGLLLPSVVAVTTGAAGSTPASSPPVVKPPAGKVTARKPPQQPGAAGRAEPGTTSGKKPGGKR
jgi:hypothetical protein